MDTLFEDNTLQNSPDESDPPDSSQAATVTIHPLHKPSQELKTIAEGLQMVWNYLYGHDFKFTGDYNIVLTEASSRSFAEVIIDIPCITCMIVLRGNLVSIKWFRQMALSVLFIDL